MAEWVRLAGVPEDQLATVMAAGDLEMRIGAFTMQLASSERGLLKYLRNIYRDTEVRLGLQEVTDVTLTVRPPSFLRKYVRPQIVPDPGFTVPAVPLPRRLTPLSFEMGMNLAVALKCCRYVNLHAAVVANDNGGILISAQSGGGKSTLAAALMGEGYRLMSDEFGLLDFDGQKLHGYPRPVSLKDESIDIVTELTGHDWMSERFIDTPKGDIAYRRVRPTDLQAAKTAVDAKLVIFPVFGKGAPGVVKRLEPSEVLMRLIPASTNYHLLGERAFEALTKMVQSCQAFEIQYGSTSTSLEIMKDLARRVGL